MLHLRLQSRCSRHPKTRHCHCWRWPQVADPANTLSFCCPSIYITAACYVARVSPAPITHTAVSCRVDTSQGVYSACQQTRWISCPCAIPQSRRIQRAIVHTDIGDQVGACSYSRDTSQQCHVTDRFSLACSLLYHYASIQRRLAAKQSSREPRACLRGAHEQCAGNACGKLSLIHI